MVPYKFVVLAPDILGVEFRGKHAAQHMALMFMRFQEYTEGLKKFRNSILPEGDMLIHYLKKKKKIYYKDGFLGFNITSHTISEIIAKKAKDTVWNKYEQALIDETLALSLVKKQKTYSVIAWVKGDKATKKHELCHAHYFTNIEYRKKVDALLFDSEISLKKAEKYLKKQGYYVGNPYILMDEINAYVTTDKPSIVKKFGLPKKIVKKLKIYRKAYIS